MASLAFSPDGTLLASAGFDTNVHLWDVSTGQHKTSLRDQLLTTFAMMFTADGKNLVIGGANGTIEIVDVQTASIARRFRAEKYAVVNMSLSPDGRSIGACTSTRMVSRGRHRLRRGSWRRGGSYDE